MRRKFGEDWTYSFDDMLADRQTDTITAILRSPIGAVATAVAAAAQLT